MDCPTTHRAGTPRRSQVAIMRPALQALPPNRNQMCLTRARVTRSMAGSLTHANQIESLPNLKCIVAVGCCRLSAATRQSTVYFDAIVTVDSPGAYIVVCRDLCTIIKILLLSNNHNITIGSPELFGDASSATRVRPRSGSRPQGCQGPGCEEGGGNGM